ncbi:MAG: SDR family NAD(P)-dependent oxidoreductase [Terriglobales bacterium]
MSPLEPTPLAGQIALVTGAGRGIGAAIATKLAALGARTILCGRTRANLEKTAAAIQKSVAPTPDSSSTGASATGASSTVSSSFVSSSVASSSIIECDVGDLRSVEAMAKTVDRTFGRLDILVNNAGIMGPSGPLHELSPEAWDQIFNTNLRGVYYTIRSLAPLMIRARTGHIINISSLAGKNPLPNGAAYAASKWGLNGLSYALAEELRAHNIRVSVICPGSVHTDFSRHEGKKSERMLQPADVAHAVAAIVTQAPQSFMSEIQLRPTQKP